MADCHFSCDCFLLHLSCLLYRCFRDTICHSNTSDRSCPNRRVAHATLTPMRAVTSRVTTFCRILTCLFDRRVSTLLWLRSWLSFELSDRQPVWRSGSEVLRHLRLCCLRQLTAGSCLQQGKPSYRSHLAYTTEPFSGKPWYRSHLAYTAEPFPGEPCCCSHQYTPLSLF